MSCSLIVPHFNDTERLDRLFNLVPINRKDIEVLVIDVCSLDQEFISSLKSRWPMVRFLSIPHKSGAGSARNVGLKHAMGEYLVFSDSDDEFVFNAFSIFDSNINENDELVYFLAEVGQKNLYSDPNFVVPKKY